MEDEWPVVRVGDVCYVTDGAHAKVDRQQHGVLYLTSKNIGVGRLLLEDVDYISEQDYERLFANSTRSQRRLSAGDILLGIIGTFGNAYLYKDQDHFGVSSAVALIRPDQRRLEARFLYYVVTSPLFRGSHGAYKAGSVQGYTNIPTIKELSVPLPPLAEQRAIAHILGTLDDKIELNRRMNETLEAMAQAIFKSWFVDFDPVRARADGRDSGLPKHITDLFPDRFDDSELGEIPAGWEVGPILKQAKLLSGGTPKTDQKDYWDGDILWGSAKDVSQCGQTFLVGTERSITQKGLDESATQLIPAYCTVVVARGATTGRMVMFGRQMAMNQTCYGLASAADTPFTLYCHLRDQMENFVHTAHGSVFDTITTSTFANTKVVLPSDSVLKAFEQKVSPIFHRVLVNTEEIQTLAALRDTLLPTLLSGELRVKDSERFIGKAV